MSLIDRLPQTNASRARNTSRSGETSAYEECRIVPQTVFTEAGAEPDTLPTLDELHEQITAVRTKGGQRKNQALANLASLKCQLAEAQNAAAKNLEAINSEIGKLEALIGSMPV